MEFEVLLRIVIARNILNTLTRNLMSLPFFTKILSRSEQLIMSSSYVKRFQYKDKSLELKKIFVTLQ